MNGLRPDILVTMSAYQYTKFSEAVATAKRIERACRKEQQVNAIGKKEDGPHRGEPSYPTQGAGPEMGPEAFYLPAQNYANNGE